SFGVWKSLNRVKHVIERNSEFGYEETKGWEETGFYLLINNKKLSNKRLSSLKLLKWQDVRMTKQKI
ncbi:MAG: hypothetical protein RMJ36_06215, partial [Candidatus Calescibacterium sp.]|nr:hypothetical protein [Candidatus Calescibacterium sp.]MDW8133230.1 hypothetical protein [Candidatus Calescibacterium sp.]